MAKWLIKKRIKNIAYISKALGVCRPLAYSLAVRGITDISEASAFTDPKLSDLADITLMRDVLKAYGIIIEEIEKQTPICIYGDYDADGVLSTTILCKALSYLGANVTYFIPDRVEDGYGLSNSSVINIAKRGIKLIITCDNGIAASEQIEIANKLGMRVIVLDHHEPAFKGEEQIIPPAEAVIDAKLKDSGYPFREMCAAGLCYRFAKGLYKYMDMDFSLLDEELVTFAGIATICDVVDLSGENRILAKKAINNMNNSIVNIGLNALVDIKNIKKITSYHIGFVIGPCINAVGRLDSAAVAVDLFLTNDEADAYEKAKLLSDINDERKLMTQQSVDKIISGIGAAPKDKILVIYNKDIHESIAGIIAGRIREAYNRPAIVLTDSHDILKGSARSIEKYDIFKGLYAHKDLLTSFGGHTMAAGLSLNKENLEPLKQALNNDCILNNDDLVEIIRIDGQLELSDITIEAASELELLAPFGKGNETPCFGTIGARVASFRFIGKEGKFAKLFLRDEKGYEASAVDFNNFDKWLDIIKSEGYTYETASMARPYVDIVFKLEVNEFNGSREPQINIKDVRKSIKKSAKNS